MQLTLPIILVLGLLSALTPLAIDAYLPSFPAIADDLNQEISTVQLTLSTYLLVFAGFQILYGPISDAVGRRKVIVFGLTGFIAGCLICAFADSFTQLMTGRVVQAIGGAAVAVTVPALVKDNLTTNQFAKAMSMVMLVMALAPLVAPILGGAILVAFNWHAIFVFLILLSLLSIVLFLRTIPETLPPEKRTPLSLRNSIRNYIKLAKDPIVMGYISAGSLHFAGMMCFVTGASFVYIELYGVEEGLFGFLFGLNVLTMMAATTINGRFVEKLGIDTLMRYAMAVLLIDVTCLVIMCFMEHPPLAAIVLGLMFFTGPIGILGSGTMGGAMRRAGSLNGSVAALAGLIRFSLGAFAGIILSAIHNGTYMPMLGIMAFCGFSTYTIYRFVRRLEAKYPSTSAQD
ncbi:Bcr/CflA family multidrug efflux MFS transporter [Marinomonas ostreistagni]|uniref:Bcr/CflA family multidrug efflux MFS transporter n=1 Tax=Marinomonas ostreistagni TaxID=359209 RepID=UPI00194EE926|nr:Bcr/CflA family multidrug efflux MFS transporter [Marinomonas ostreistagni]MBM6551960.1 Bcr/CflA family multidrug efflux MFS transporter [Marinomonas ostreistagni]